ncbi:hypothetical protein J3A83DRAFT_4189009 [Scleroderma citrinum]
MPPRKAPSDLFKVGPQGVLRSLRKSRLLPHQPRFYQCMAQSYTIKSSNTLEPFSAASSRNCDTSPQPNNLPQLGDEECSMHHSEGMTKEECEEKYLNSFCFKIVTLQSGKQLYPQVALNQLCTGVISGKDILCDGDGEEKLAAPSNTATDNAVQKPCKTAVNSEEDEQAVNDATVSADQAGVVEDTDYEDKYPSSYMNK